MSSTVRVDVNTFLDSQVMGLRQWMIIFLGFMTLAVDGFDMIAMGLIASPLATDWGIKPQDLGPAMMSGLFGLVIGSLCSGPLADRFGRKWIVVGSVFFFGLWSFVSAYAWDLTSLVVLRLLTGVGLGAAMPNITTLVSEYAPKRYRAHIVTAIYCGFNVGAALGSLGSDALVHLYGWRSVLIAGGVIPAFLAVILVMCLPESIRFLAQDVSKYRDALVKLVNQFVPHTAANASTEFFSSEEKIVSQSSLKSLFSGKYRLGTLTIWTTLLVGLFSVYLMSSWLPTLMKEAGMTLTGAAIMASLYQAGGAAGNFFVGMMMDRLGHHKAIILTILLGAVTAFTLAFLPPIMGVMGPLVFLLGYTVNGINPSCYALAAHFYPTKIRATGVSWATGIGRIGAIVGAGVGAQMLAAGWSVNNVFMFMPVVLIMGAIAIGIKHNKEKRAAS